MIYTSFTNQATIALRAQGVTSYCSQICGDFLMCGNHNFCRYGVDPRTEMPATIAAQVDKLHRIVVKPKAEAVCRSP